MVASKCAMGLTNIVQILLKWMAVAPQIAHVAEESEQAAVTEIYNDNEHLNHHKQMW
jgi:hypothetical protein